MSTDKIEIANTIIKQLGGQRFKVMTGAKDFTTLSNVDGVGFKIRAKANKSINYVKVSLVDDLYNMEFGRIRKLEYKIVDHIEGVYNDQLQEVFTQYTGLYTHL